MENFITEIKIKTSRNINNFNIPLSNDKRQHLILTGKNGSGKTSLLLEINKYLYQIDNGNLQHRENYITALKQAEDSILVSNNQAQIGQLKNNIKNYNNFLNNFGGTELCFSNSQMEIFNSTQNGEFLLTYFDAKRHSEINIPQGINKLSLQKKYRIQDKASTTFLQYLVNLKADRSFARDDEEFDTVTKIDNWFLNFEQRLAYIFDVTDLKLKFNRKNYNFDIVINDVEPFNFNNLSDGYSAIISIISELILRMESHKIKSYDLEGIVIIDEIETHLHVDLQKKILPFLIDFFPKLQFIVTTHSPFILSSISNATICDLENKSIINDLSNYSYDALIESYFDTDKYSLEIKEKVKEFEDLLAKGELTMSEEIKLKKIRNYFSHTPKYLSDELIVKIQQIELKYKIDKKEI